MATEKEKVEKSQIMLNQSPTSATDSVSISSRSDGDIMIQLFSIIPGTQVENHRTIIKKELAVSLINILSAATDHYPKRPKATTKKKVAIKKGPTKN
jgi:hypothetical protein